MPAKAGQLDGNTAWTRPRKEEGLHVINNGAYILDCANEIDSENMTEKQIARTTDDMKGDTKDDDKSNIASRGRSME